MIYSSRIFSAACVIALLVSPVAHAADSTPKEHGWNMQRCMPDMEAHCRMNEAMEQMQKEMDVHRTMSHCMPKMTTHCQTIADLEYMEKRMEHMRADMQHCMENEKDCPMPEMTGEMTAMQKKMDELAKAAKDKHDG